MEKTAAVCYSHPSLIHLHISIAAYLGKRTNLLPGRSHTNHKPDRAERPIALVIHRHQTMPGDSGRIECQCVQLMGWNQKIASPSFPSPPTRPDIVRFPILSRSSLILTLLIPRDAFSESFLADYFADPRLLTL
jgi:hypothetical protein